MKVAILAGGLGTRLSEETSVKPKPMVEVGGRPILWHIMKIYSSYGFNEFVIALGYKGEIIKDYFVNYRYRFSNLTVSLATGEVDVHHAETDDWAVHLLDTGQDTQTGGRLKKIAEFIGDETFMLTYGDGVTNLNIHELVNHHQEHKRLATVTAVRPPARFGGLSLDGDQVKAFEEKPQIGEGWINGGYFVLEPEVADYIDNSLTIWEREPLEKIASAGQLSSYRHYDFWQSMDTLRDVRLLNQLWDSGKAPWRIW